MSPRYAFRLEDLRVFHLVRVSCRACGHKGVIPNATLLHGRPGYTRLMSLERQLDAGNAEREARHRSMWSCGRVIDLRCRETWRGASRSQQELRR
jgi:hypothetical protein